MIGQPYDYTSAYQRKWSRHMQQQIEKPTVLAGTFGECVAEFMGTMILVLFGDGALATFALFTNTGLGGTTTAFANQWIVVALGWGFAIMLGIYVAGTVSGGHINPAVTLALALRGKFPWRKVVPYWVAQVFGAFVAALIVFLVYRGAIDNYILTSPLPLRSSLQTVEHVFYTAPQPFVGLFGAFCDEFVGTALLVGLIFALIDARNRPVQANLNPLIIGFLFAAIALSFGLNTGFAINPARDFGPRLWIAIVFRGLSFVNNYWWIPIVAPLLGGAAGAYIYDFTVGRVLSARHEVLSGGTIT
jgi:glycerol uptake facilitator protein